MFDRYGVHLASTIFSGEHFELSGNSLQQYFGKIKIIMIIKKNIGIKEGGDGESEDRPKIDQHLISVDTKDVVMMSSKGNTLSFMMQSENGGFYIASINKSRIDLIEFTEPELPEGNEAEEGSEGENEGESASEEEEEDEDEEEELEEPDGEIEEAEEVEEAEELEDEGEEEEEEEEEKERAKKKKEKQEKKEPSQSPGKGGVKARLGIFKK